MPSHSLMWMGIGVSYLTTFLARHQQISRVGLAAHLNHGNIFFENFFNGLVNQAHSTTRALAQLDGMVSLQASTLAFSNAFWFMGVVVGCLIPLPFIMKRPSAEDMKAAEGMH